MPRNYRNISMYEKEIIELKRQGAQVKKYVPNMGLS